MKSMAMKLWLGMMSLVMVVLVLLWLFQIVFLDSFYSKLRIANIKNSGMEIVEILETGDQAGFENRLTEMAVSNNLSAELLDQQQEALFSAGTTGGMEQMPMFKNNQRIDGVNRVLSGQTVLLAMSHPRFDIQVMMIGLPVTLPGGNPGALVISMPMADIADTVDILKEQLFYITIILLIAALILSFLLARSFSRPILEMTKVSQEMAGGNLSARINVTRRDEIGRLGQTINEMGEELLKVDQLRKDLIANISHELRTPLSIIKGYAETIRDISGNLPEKRDKHVEIIIEETDRLSTIVDDILHLSQLQAGYLPLTLQQFRVDDTLARVCKRYEILSSQTGISIELKNRNAVKATGDEARIEQVLYNLINNAFNHSHSGDVITINAWENQQKVRFEVADTGEGIPEKEIDHIWDRFYKVDQSGQRSMSGSGLGLAIVKNILMAHGADFGVHSQVGLGTTFWFEINK